MLLALTRPICVVGAPRVKHLLADIFAFAIPLRVKLDSVLASTLLYGCSQELSPSERARADMLKEATNAVVGRKSSKSNAPRNIPIPLAERSETPLPLISLTRTAAWNAQTCRCSSRPIKILTEHNAGDAKLILIISQPSARPIFENVCARLLNPRHQNPGSGPSKNPP
jgi:hypothetical protein